MAYIRAPKKKKKEKKEPTEMRPQRVVWPGAGVDPFRRLAAVSQRVAETDGNETRNHRIKRTFGWHSTSVIDNNYNNNNNKNQPTGSPLRRETTTTTTKK